MVEVYSNGDPGLVLDDEFTKFLPPLSEEERDKLAEDIKAHGCISPLIVWENSDGHKYLLDGYHRYEICQEHHVPFHIKTIDGLVTRSDAMGWMLQHQLGRRNMSTVQRIKAVSEYRELLEKEAASRMKKGKPKKSKDGPEESDGSEVEDVAGNADDRTVNKRIGALAGVSREQVRRFRKVEKYATPEELDDLNAGRLTINRLHSKYCQKPSDTVETGPEAEAVSGDTEPTAPADNETAVAMEPVASADEVESELAGFPLSSTLAGRQLEIFKKDARDYLYFAEYRKKLADVARARFKKGGGKGPWAQALTRFLKCEHPKDWLLCPDPENGGCSGTGVYEFGECPRCHGAGYWIKGTYVLSTKA